MWVCVCWLVDGLLSRCKLLHTYYNKQRLSSERLSVVSDFDLAWTRMGSGGEHARVQKHGIRNEKKRQKSIIKLI